MCANRPSARGPHLCLVFAPSSVTQTAMRTARKYTPYIQHKSTRAAGIKKQSQQEGSISLFNVKRRQLNTVYTDNPLQPLSDNNQAPLQAANQGSQADMKES